MGVLTGSTDPDAAKWALLLVNKPVMMSGGFVF
jgi:hypothetical protein